MNESAVKAYLPENKSFPDRLVCALGTFLDPRSYLHAFRIIHYYSYSHVQERRRLKIGEGTRIAPNASFCNSERIEIGRSCHVGARCHLWAGGSTGRIIIGDYVSMAPDVFITASDYQFIKGKPFREQPMRDQDVMIGNDVWLGARVIITSGVTIGDGCIVGAGAVVTKSLSPDSVAAGVPAKVISRRQDSLSE